jgi:hypothetical protein
LTQSLLAHAFINNISMPTRHLLSRKAQ